MLDPDAADRHDVVSGTSHGLGEHQVRFDFYDDSGAETFDSWWWREGQHAFKSFCNNARHEAPPCDCLPYELCNKCGKYVARGPK